jgi:hypothetical protein
MGNLIDTFLLLALPASGKSEVRTYLASLTDEQCRAEFHMGPTVQLDDFPYVHLMRRIDDELTKLGVTPLFFRRPDQPFQDAVEWGTLIELLNEDYADLKARAAPTPTSYAQHLFDRLERARKRVGGQPKLDTLDAGARAALGRALEAESRELQQKKQAECPASLEGKTVVIEFARGGPDGATMPLQPPLGYQYSLSLLSDEILRRASVLYIWVTPEESRRKNDARADPNDPGSILHHGVPLDVMMKDYGCDDMEHLIRQSERPNTISITARGRTYHLPVARFDNRVDRTTFVREDRARWRAEDVEALHRGLAAAFTELYRGAAPQD